MTELLRRSLLRPFEDLCAKWGTIATISGAFEDEGFEAAADLLPDSGASTRRGTFNDYVAGCDLANPADVGRLLRAFETILGWVPETEWVAPPGSHPFDLVEKISQEHSDRQRVRKHLGRDGYELDERGRIVSGSTPALVKLPLEQLRDASAIQEHLDRLDAAADSDPALAISAAKALMEATCKHVLDELAEPYSDRADIPVLVRAVQTALKVHPDQIAPTVKGREIIQRTLSSLYQVTIGVAELRNEYGPDHGRTRSSAGLHPRHAHLAVGAAQTFCRFLLETLRDRRRAQPAPA